MITDQEWFNIGPDSLASEMKEYIVPRTTGRRGVGMTESSRPAKTRLTALKIWVYHFFFVINDDGDTSRWAPAWDDAWIEWESVRTDELYSRRMKVPSIKVQRGTRDQKFRWEWKIKRWISRSVFRAEIDLRGLRGKSRISGALLHAVQPSRASEY